jgi:hypothetical protein
MQRKSENARKLGKEPVILKWQWGSGECGNWAWRKGEEKDKKFV